MKAILSNGNAYDMLSNAEKELLDPDLALLEAEIKEFNEKSKNMGNVVNQIPISAEQTAEILKKFETLKMQYNTLLNRYKILIADTKGTSIKLRIIQSSLKDIKEIFNPTLSNSFQECLGSLKTLLFKKDGGDEVIRMLMQMKLQRKDEVYASEKLKEDKRNQTEKHEDRVVEKNLKEQLEEIQAIDDNTFKSNNQYEEVLKKL